MAKKENVKINDGPLKESTDMGNSNPFTGSVQGRRVALPGAGGGASDRRHGRDMAGRPGWLAGCLQQRKNNTVLFMPGLHVECPQSPVNLAGVHYKCSGTQKERNRQKDME